MFRGPRNDPRVYYCQAASAMREAIQLLSQKDVYSQGELEELIILKAPRWDEWDVHFQGTPLFKIEVDLANQLRLGFTGSGHDSDPQRARELLKIFNDYQWSKTPENWRAYFSARKLASYVPNAALFDGRAIMAVECLHSSLHHLANQQNVSVPTASEPLGAQLEKLTKLKQRCEELPAKITAWEYLTTIFSPNAPERTRGATRRTEILAITDELKGLCSDLQPQLVAFGKEYRTQYIADHTAAPTESETTFASGSGI